MTLELEALSPEDGWAIVSEADDVYLVRPPYRRAQRQKLSADRVASVVARLELRPAAGSFSGWKELIEHLHQEMDRSSDPQLLEEAERATRQVLEKASRDDLNRLLDRLESELGSGSWRAAERAVIVLLGLDTVIDDPALFSRCRHLLQGCAAARERSEEHRVKSWRKGRETWLKSLNPVYDRREIAQFGVVVSQRHQVMSIHA